MKTVMISMAMVLGVLITGSSVYAQQPQQLPSHPKNNSPMKEYVFIVSVNPKQLTQEQIEKVRAGWDKVTAEWKANKHYLYGNPVVQAGVIVSGNNRTVAQEELGDAMRVVSFINIEAESDEQALELAKMVPVLDFGGKVEIRKPLRAAVPVSSY
ncbi:YciI family protein [Chitinophaga sp. Hz27]|uniref:YciI family protein n=1 Tax=Chitinophaga sp. Hz27 TaxID=3347169 RepID=UPI0035DDF0E6